MQRILIAGIILSLVCVMGCKPKAPYGVVPIEGIVTYQGKPLPQAFQLTFRPADGKRTSTGRIKADDGKFITIHTLQEDGVPVGKCYVTVSWAGLMGTSTPKEYAALVQKYGPETQGLEVEISKKDKNFKLDFP